MFELTPRKIVTELDQYIIGQHDAKRAVAIAIRNRWRRQMVEDDMKKEIGPKNILMIGPTGVGKTEIARRLATLTGAPFIKVEATKYTEVGYYGRDVESMVRELVENAIGIVRTRQREMVRQKAEEEMEEALLDLIDQTIQRADREARQAELQTKKEKQPVKNEKKQGSPDVPFDPTNPFESFRRLLDGLNESLNKPENTNIKSDENTPDSIIKAIQESLKSSNDQDDEKLSDNDEDDDEDDFDDYDDDVQEALTAAREEIRRNLRSGLYENELVTISLEQKISNVMVGSGGMESMENDIQNMVENIFPKRTTIRQIPVSEARKILLEQRCDRLIDKDKVNAEAVELAENLGIIFIDEIDKIVSSGQQHGADVSRQGVQRDLLPIVEGTTIQTKYGLVSTDHILFIAAGAFHRAKPTDLMPELQGRFPIRVELSDLTCDDFTRILTEPHGALTKQYVALMKTEGVTLDFDDEAIRSIAQYAFQVNQTTQNIGARRLYTIMERLLEELSFEAPDMKMGNVLINGSYVSSRLKAIVDDENLNRFIL